MFDIFSLMNASSDDFLKIKRRFPTVRPIASIDEAARKSFTKMYWIIPLNVVVADDFKFDYKVDAWEQSYTHSFKNGDKFNGITLVPKKGVAEIQYIEIVASTPKPYDIFFLRNKDDIDTHFSLFLKDYPTARRVTSYEEATAASSTDMCWVVPLDVVPVLEFKFDHIVDSFDKQYVHVFNLLVDDYSISLIPKTKKLTADEKRYKFFNKSKLVQVHSAIERPDDVIFISYNELNADSNFELLLSKVPYAKRIDGVKGIHAAHKAAAKIASTKMFWVLDGDAQVVNDFKFVHEIYKWDLDCVYVWRSINPVNGLEYGYGGAKLFPRKQTLELDELSVDMTTSISNKFNIMDEISNVTAFNTDPFSTWRSAFRECAKLASSAIDRHISEDTQYRLDVWCTVNNDAEFGEWALLGAVAGKAYGEEHADSLQNINNFDWLHEQFSKHSVE